MDPQLIAAIAAVGLLVMAALKFAYDLSRDVGRRDLDP
jgi:hypothetical protein